MAQGFQIDVFNNTERTFNLKIQNVSMGTGTYDVWQLPAQTSLSTVVGGHPLYYELGSGATGAISIQAQLDFSTPFTQVVAVEFDSSALTNFREGVIFYGSNADISPGLPLPGSPNYMFASLHLGVYGNGDTQWTLGTVILLEAVGATQDLP
jgi:hypothetical protein